MKEISRLKKIAKNNNIDFKNNDNLKIITMLEEELLDLNQKNFDIVLKIIKSRK